LPRGESTDPVGKKFEQSCGLTIDADGVIPSFVTTTAPSGEAAFSARFYLLASALDISSGDVTVFTARNVDEIEVELRLRDTGGVISLVAFYQTNGGLTEHPNPIALEDVWTAVEVSWSAGNGDGTFLLKVDDFPKYDQNDLVNTDAVINEVDLGVVNSASASGEVVFDAFDLRRTTSPGLLTINEMFGISTRADVLFSATPTSAWLCAGALLARRSFLMEKWRWPTPPSCCTRARQSSAPIMTGRTHPIRPSCQASASSRHWIQMQRSMTVLPRVATRHT
jgi:hypothetical protein